MIKEYTRDIICKEQMIEVVHGEGRTTKKIWESKEGTQQEKLCRTIIHSPSTITTIV